MCACGIQLVFKGNRAKCMACKRKYKKLGPEKVVEDHKKGVEVVPL